MLGDFSAGDAEVAEAAPVTCPASRTEIGPVDPWESFTFGGVSAGPGLAGGKIWILVRWLAKGQLA